MRAERGRGEVEEGREGRDLPHRRDERKKNRSKNDEVDRETGGADHGTGGADHGTRGTDHVTEGADHGRDVDHEIAQSTRKTVATAAGREPRPTNKS